MWEKMERRLVCTAGNHINRVLCKVRGDEKVEITNTQRVTTEMGSVMGDLSIAADVEGDRVCEETSSSWDLMLRMRTKVR